MRYVKEQFKEEWIRFFFRQDLSAKQKADFQQDLRDFFRLRRGALSAGGHSIPMILSKFVLKT